MPMYRFKTCCPVCLNPDKYLWEHSDDDGDIYIWHNCQLQCNYCGEKSSILYWQFNCKTSGHHTYKSCNKMQIIAAVSQIASLDNISGEIKRDMLNALYDM